MVARRPKISRLPRTVGQFRAQLTDLRFPDSAVTGLMDYYAAFRSGWGNQPHPDLRTLLDRAPTDTLDAVRQRIPQTT